MRKIRLKIPFIIFLFFSITATSQTNAFTDSFNKIWLTTKEDSNKLKALNKQVFELTKYSGTVPYLPYAKQAVELAEKLNYKSGKAIAYYQLGLAYSVEGNYPEALEYAHKALVLGEEVGNKRLIAGCLNEIAYHYFENGNLPLAEQKVLVALQIRKEIGDSSAIVQTSNFLGEIFMKQGKYTEALQLFTTSLHMLSSMQDPIEWGKPYCYEAIGSVLELKGDSAFEASNKPLSKDYYKNAVNNYLLSLEGWKKIDRKDGIAEIYDSLGHIYTKQGELKLARKYLTMALTLGNAIHDKAILVAINRHFYQLNYLEGNYKQALKYYTDYISYKDSMMYNETSKKIIQFQAQYDYDKKTSLIKLEQEKKDAVYIERIKKHKLIRNFSLIAIGCILLLTVFGFYQYKKHKRTESQQSLINERFRISQELHDEVGATLSGIAMYSHLAKEQIKNNQPGTIENSLNIIQSNSGEMVNKLNDIVWLINPDHDSLQKVMQRLEDYAIQIAAVKNIRVRSNFNGYFSESILSAQTRRNIYLLFKEAINNAVKYSNATQLELTIKKENTSIIIAVADNGDGFSPDAVKLGNGLNNMKLRAKEMQTDCVITSVNGEGTTITIIIKLP